MYDDTGSIKNRGRTRSYTEYVHREAYMLHGKGKKRDILRLCSGEDIGFRAGWTNGMLRLRNAVHDSGTRSSIS